MNIFKRLSRRCVVDENVFRKAPIMGCEDSAKALVDYIVKDAPKERKEVRKKARELKNFAEHLIDKTKKNGELRESPDLCEQAKERAAGYYLNAADTLTNMGSETDIEYDTRPRRLWFLFVDLGRVSDCIVDAQNIIDSLGPGKAKDTLNEFADSLRARQLNAVSPTLGDIAFAMHMDDIRKKNAEKMENAKKN